MGQQGETSIQAIEKERARVFEFERDATKGKNENIE